jgi:threonine/homoserine/homoserine lactone efflux protein
MIAMLMSAYSLGLIISLPPGALTIATLQHTFSRGFWNAIVFNLGVVASDILYLLLVYFGIHALLAGNEPLRMALFVLSGAWLNWLGISALRQPLSLAQNWQNAAHGSAWRSFHVGFVMNLLNPLTLAGWASIAGNFFNTWHLHWPPLMPFGLVAIALMLVGVISWQFILILLTNFVRKLMQPRFLRGLSVAGGILLCLYGVSAWLVALNLIR